MACAMVASRHRIFDDDPKKLYAKYETKNGAVHVRLLINNFEGLPATHVHIDTAREAAFSEHPETNASIDDVMSELGKIETNEVSVRGCAKFELPSDALPQVGVIALLRQVTTGPADANVRLTGSTFQIEDGPITNLEWKVCEDYGNGELIRAEVHSEAEMEWGHDYIVESLQPAIDAFRTFVLEETVESEVENG